MAEAHSSTHQPLFFGRLNQIASQALGASSVDPHQRLLVFLLLLARTASTQACAASWYFQTLLPYQHSPVDDSRTKIVRLGVVPLQYAMRDFTSSGSRSTS